MVEIFLGNLSATDTINVSMDQMKNIVNDSHFLRHLHLSNFFSGFCQGDVYACLQGNNVSCRLACATYGRVTCITYQNRRACEQYNRVLLNNSSDESSIFMNYFDAVEYSACLAIGMLFVLAIFFILMYLIRKKLFQFLFPCCMPKFHRLSSSSHYSSRLHYTPTPDLSDFPSSYRSYDECTISIDDLYEPPPYSDSMMYSSIDRSNSIYYETIKTPSMSMLNPLPLPEPFKCVNLRTHSV